VLSEPPPERDSFVARQPIFDAALELVGYELLFRDLGEEGQLDQAAEAATVLVEGLDACGLGGVAADRRVWLSVPRELRLDPDSIRLPPSRTSLFVADITPTEVELRALDDLRARGYRLALQAPVAEQAVLERVDIVRWSMAEPPESLGEEMQRARASGVSLLAGDVETREQQKLAQGLDVDLLQGSFFCEPESVAADGPAPSKLATLEVLAALQRPDITFSELEALISRDVVLSYRLLRYINSAFFGLRRPVDSVGKVVVLLGLANLKRWVTMTVLAGIDTKPAELLTTALARARFCELAGSGRGEPDQLFTLGLFSVLDALMEAPMSEVIRPVPLPSDMKRALTVHQGAMGELLEVTVACEHGRLPEDSTVSERRRLAGAYAEALEWASVALAELSAEP
jgi:EAL and modified HD-GYP domain-containing signal transduction protein